MEAFSSKILITGGTGSFGKAFIQHCIENNLQIKRLVIFSRDELKQWKCRKNIPQENFHN